MISCFYYYNAHCDLTLVSTKVDPMFPKLITKSIYAITEFSRKYLDKYKIISCPGCYPTSIQIPLIPLIEKFSSANKKV